MAGRRYAILDDLTKLSLMTDDLTPPSEGDVFHVLKSLAADDKQELLFRPHVKPTVILAIDSEKGGVGKTALTTGLAAVAGEAGVRVLVIDLDPRATATAELGIEEPEYTVNDLLYTGNGDDPEQIRGAAAEAIVSAGEGWPENVHVLASERNLGHREMDPSDGLDLRLKLSLEGVTEFYDLILIDIPPRAGGKLVSTAFHAATHVLLPATLDEDGFDGAKEALTSIRRLLAYYPNSVEVVGIVRNIVDRRPTGLAKLFDEKMTVEFGPLLLQDAAVARYVVRQEARAACIPFTKAVSSEVDTLRRGYVAVLNHLWSKI